ncbi:MAG TPA: hypothetical protein VKB72_07500 [Steroidobacteraceae bacterium]|nr:hypothetical protein [Steroidobacteraceae bacterium]
MRLLDHVAQCTVPFLVRQKCGAVWRLTSAGDFSQAVSRCPLRFVLTDELLRVCIELAYSQRDELCSCLDLVRLPAERLWVEWSEPARREALRRVIPEYVAADAMDVERSGVLICAEGNGRSGSLRTFFLTGGEAREPLVAALETLLDLDGNGTSPPPGTVRRAGLIAVCDPQHEHLNDVLRCARFRLDPAWQRYYQSVLPNPAAGAQVIRLLISSVAFDIPMLLALFLLMATRAALVRQAVRPEPLNRKRAKLGRPPLLEHVEVSAPLFIQGACRDRENPGTARNRPRFHHVRGHIVRRHNTVYWRGPHWRGHLRLGRVLSRTVELRLH